MVPVFLSLLLFASLILSSPLKTGVDLRTSSQKNTASAVAASATPTLTPAAELRDPAKRKKERLDAHDAAVVTVVEWVLRQGQVASGASSGSKASKSLAGARLNQIVSASRSYKGGSTFIGVTLELERLGRLEFHRVVVKEGGETNAKGGGRVLVSDSIVDSPFSMTLGRKDWGEIVEVGPTGGSRPASGGSEAQAPAAAAGAPAAGVPNGVGSSTGLIEFLVDTASKEPSNVTVPLGATFHLKLRGNPTTGYSWTTRKARPLVGKGGTGGKAPGQGEVPLVEQIGDWDFKTAPTCKRGMVGCGGMFELAFKAKRVGVTDIKMDYVRPWLKDEAAAESPADATVRVNVVNAT